VILSVEEPVYHCSTLYQIIKLFLPVCTCCLLWNHCWWSFVEFSEPY